MFHFEVILWRRCMVYSIIVILTTTMNQSQQEKIIDLKKRYHRAIDGRRSTVDLIDSAEISEGDIQ
jgi:hypothetical protein